MTKNWSREVVAASDTAECWLVRAAPSWRAAQPGRKRGGGGFRQLCQEGKGVAPPQWEKMSRRSFGTVRDV